MTRAHSAEPQLETEGARSGMANLVRIELLVPSKARRGSRHSRHPHLRNSIYARDHGSSGGNKAGADPLGGPAALHQGEEQMRAVATTEMCIELSDEGKDCLPRSRTLSMWRDGILDAQHSVLSIESCAQQRQHSFPSDTGSSSPISATGDVECASPSTSAPRDCDYLSVSSGDFESPRNRKYTRSPGLHTAPLHGARRARQARSLSPEGDADQGANHALDMPGTGGTLSHCDTHQQIALLL